MLAEPTWTLLRRYRLDEAALIATIEGLLSRVLLDVEGASAVMPMVPQRERRFRGLPCRRTQSHSRPAPTYPFDEQATSSPAFALIP
jgi:hypothetical protein